MTQPTNDHNNQFDSALLPSSDAEGSNAPQETADQQFMHGLLAHLHHDNPETQQQRVASVLNAIDHENNSNPLPFPRLKLRIPHLPQWSILTSSAAAILLLVTWIALIPTERTALAIIQQTIDAIPTAGDRSYEIYSSKPGTTELADQPHAYLDIRNTTHLLLRATPPNNPRGLILGRNEAGSWNIRRDGSIDHYSAEWIWPDWLEFGERTLLIQSIDNIIAQLPANDYTLSLSEPATLPTLPTLPNSADSNSPLYDRITATKEISTDSQPNKIELWINPQNNFVTRMELHWPPSQNNPDPRPRPGPGQRPRPRPGQDRLQGQLPPPPPPGGFRREPPRHQQRNNTDPPPPAIMVFELTPPTSPPTPLPDNWFDPETHQTANDDQ